MFLLIVALLLGLALLLFFGLLMNSDSHTDHNCQSCGVKVRTRGQVGLQFCDTHLFYSQKFGA